MSEPIYDKSYLEFFKSIIRYLASGFVFIMVVQLLRHDNNLRSIYQSDTNWTMMIVAGICGITIYAIHAAFLDDIFYRISLWWLIKKSPDDKFYVPEQFKDTKGAGGKKQVKKLSEIMFALTSYRYKREGTTNPELISTQNRLEQLLAILVFLYTTSYTLIVIPLVWTIRNLLVFSLANLRFNTEYFLIAMAGLFLMTCAFILDLKITKRELYLLKNEAAEFV